MAVLELVYWKDTGRTGMLLTGLVLGLLSLFQLSIITLASGVSLAVMCLTISVRLYYKLLHTLQLTDATHPFQSYLDLDIRVSGEDTRRHIARVILLLFSAVDTLRNLCFVENLLDSFKFFLLMYLLTFMGSLCNGLTFLITGVIAAFSLPLFYTRHKENLNVYLKRLQAFADNIQDFFRRLTEGGVPSSSDHTPGGAKPKAY